jgi:hypothetical protein
MANGCMVMGSGVQGETHSVGLQERDYKPLTWDSAGSCRELAHNNKRSERVDILVVNGINGVCKQLYSHFAGHEAAGSRALSIAPLFGVHLGSTWVS